MNECGCSGQNIDAGGNGRLFEVSACLGSGYGRVIFPQSIFGGVGSQSGLCETAEEEHHIFLLSGSLSCGPFAGLVPRVRFPIETSTLHGFHRHIVRKETLLQLPPHCHFLPSFAQFFLERIK